MWAHTRQKVASRSGLFLTKPAVALLHVAMAQMVVPLLKMMI